MRGTICTGEPVYLSRRRADAVLHVRPGSYTTNWQPIRPQMKNPRWRKSVSTSEAIRRLPCFTIFPSTPRSERVAFDQPKNVERLSAAGRPFHSNIDRPMPFKLLFAWNLQTVRDGAILRTDGIQYRSNSQEPKNMSSSAASLLPCGTSIIMYMAPGDQSGSDTTLVILL